ncbi:MAG: peptidase T [Candidatus Eisenbacteria bacterium]|nr:peptidase T [Candidatus Eisenbacteria bacterium]
MRSLIVHGGAWQIPDAEIADHRAGLLAALTRGTALLLEGRPAIDIVVETVALLEEDLTFDAGRGSVLNLDGRIEMDASVMDGRTLGAGCVACITDVLHPIRVARAILEDGRAVMLAGEGASRFARSAGIPACSFEELLSPRETRRKRFLDRIEDFKTRQPFDGSLPQEDSVPPGPLGTVGALCCDARGDLAAATSTGGAPNTLAGRVGDSPVPGAGTWAENGMGAAGSTGWGEAILRDLLAFRAVQEIDTLTIDWRARGRELPPPHPIATTQITWGPLRHGPRGAAVPRAARRAIQGFARRVGGAGGVILLGPDGVPGFAFNTPRMVRGFWMEGMDDPVIETEPDAPRQAAR